MSQLSQASSLHGWVAGWLRQAPPPLQSALPDIGGYGEDPVAALASATDAAEGATEVGGWMPKGNTPTGLRTGTAGLGGLSGR